MGGRRLGLVGSACFVFAVVPAYGQTSFQWLADNNQLNNFYDDPSNWFSSGVPGAGDTAVFLFQTSTVSWGLATGNTATDTILVDGGEVTFFADFNQHVSQTIEIGSGPLGSGNLTVMGPLFLEAQVLLEVSDRGTLRLEDGARLTAPSQSLLAGGGLLDIEAGVGILGTVDLNPGGTLALQSQGSLTIDVLNQNGGVFDFDAGLLTVNQVNGGLVQNGGTLAPGGVGSTGVSSWTQDHTQSDGTLSLEIGGLVPGTSFDQLTADQVVLSGDSVLDLSLINGFTPSLGDAFVVLSAPNGLTGTFGSVVGQLPAGSDALAVTYQWGSVTVTAAQVGDLNLDTRVDGNDFGLFASQFGQLTGRTWVDGDLNGDGAVDGNDFGLFAANFGAGTVLTPMEIDALEAFAATVPEPGTAALGLSGLVLGFWRRGGWRSVC